MGFEDLKEKQTDTEKIEPNNDNFVQKAKLFFFKDSMIYGILLGIILPIISYFIIKYINLSITLSDGIVKTHYLEESTVYVLSIVANIIIFRYYMVKRKADKTGKGILLATIIYALTFFSFFNKM